MGLRWPRSYSADVRNAEPIHTPCAPSASAAATCRPVPMPPAASTGALPPSASTISGHSTIEPISPVWPPASWPCATTMSTPFSTWRCACLALPARAATGTPAACTWSMTSFGGEPRALAINLIGCLSATSTCDRATECSQPSTPALRSSSSGNGGTPRSARVLVDEVAMTLRDELVDVDWPCPPAAPWRASRCRRRRACRRCSRPSSTARSRDRRRR